MLAKVPQSRPERWLLRFGLAVPFALLTIALATGAPDYFLHQTANAALIERAQAVFTQNGSVAVVLALYPPVATILALVVPGGVVGLGILGSLCAGFYLQKAVEWFTRQRLGVLVQLILVLLVAGSPLLAFLVTTNLEIALGLVLFGLGMIDLVRFIVFANTQAGFRVGLYFAVAALTAPAFVFSIVVSACVAPFLVHSRRGARRANALVIMFPTAAAFGSVAVLALAFRQVPVLEVLRGIVEFDPDRVALVSGLLGGPWGWLYFVPTLAGILLALVLRRPLLAVAPPLITASILLMALTGNLPSGSSGTNFLILMVIAVALIPRRLLAWQQWAVFSLAATQVAVGWATALWLYPSVELWIQAVTGGGGS